MEETNFSMDKDGKFNKPTLKAYNDSRKYSIYYNKEQINSIKSRAIYQISDLKREIEEIKAETKERISNQKAIIEEKKRPLTPLEFKKIAEETKKSLLELIEERKKEVK